MAISDKTRRVIWGRSGNRCAVCRLELVLAASPKDDESLIGEECHIVSGSGNGPRHDPAFPIDRLDGAENLLLLCRIHHKLIDDQDVTYDADALRALKARHEAWVSSSLGQRRQPVRVRRLAKNVPERLMHLTSAQEIMSLVQGTYSLEYRHDQLESDTEAELIGELLQEVKEWADVYRELEPSESVRTAHRLGELLHTAEDAGFFLFGAREIRQLHGGDDTPMAWPVALLHVSRTGEWSSDIAG